MIAWVHRLPWSMVIFACLTLGLAPFVPPHVLEKIGMLAQGELVRPIDWFDLLFHGAPWALLGLKVVALGERGRSASS